MMLLVLKANLNHICAHSSLVIAFKAASECCEGKLNSSFFKFSFFFPLVFFFTFKELTKPGVKEANKLRRIYNNLLKPWFFLKLTGT